MPEVLSDQCFSAKRVAEVSQKLTEDLSVSQKEVTYALFENEPIQPEAVETEKEETRNLVIAKEVTTSSPPPKMQIVWRNVAIMAILHGLAIYGLSQVHLIKWQTFYFTFVVAVLNSLGVQAGAHRLWAHRSYKANFGVRLFLSLCHVLALQNDLYEWCRDHRGHHKFSDTRADPHNSNRGFFFSHVGWLLCKKDPEVLRRGKTLDLSDLEADPIVMFQRKFYIPMIIIFWGFLPTFIPVHFWGEGVWNAFLATVIVRYVYALNVTWCVNSWAHLYGNRPYDKKIAPVEATIRHLLMGEGFHNYHHAFPWDYSASELGPLDVFNPTTAAIDFFHYMGWAWDLKKVNPTLIDKKMTSSGEVGPSVQSYKEKSTASEWIGGVITFFGPMVFLRYLFMAIFS